MHTHMYTHTNMFTHVYTNICTNIKYILFESSGVAVKMMMTVVMRVFVLTGH